MTNMMKALCCTCGNLRTCRRARNHRAENYWFAGTIDRDWHRETGELKCSECDRVTVHALIHPDNDSLRDHAEMMQRVATGNTHTHLKAHQIAEIRSKYRQGMPRNPELNHYWWTAEAKKAWDAGRREVTALCGEPMTIERDPGGPSSSKPTDKREDRQIEPKTVREQEYEDPETGLSWIEMDCVDCLRVWHLELLRQRRKVLTEQMTVFLADLIEDNSGYPKRFDLSTINEMIELIKAAYPLADAATEDANR